MASELTFGAWLRRRRRALDLTREELAQRVSCSVSAVRRMEADELRPSKQLAEALAATLEIAPSDRSTFVRFARDTPGADTMRLPIPTVSLQLPASPAIVRSTLPVQPTSLIGREQEVASVCALLRRSDIRLLTLIGSGGIGKTRLALQVASELLDDFADGVAFIHLAPVPDAALVLPTTRRHSVWRKAPSSPLRRRPRWRKRSAGRCTSE
jgi:transcriptional regulator with XRE-family HTH domain